MSSQIEASLLEVQSLDIARYRAVLDRIRRKAQGGDHAALPEIASQAAKVLEGNGDVLSGMVFKASQAGMIAGLIHAVTVLSKEGPEALDSLIASASLGDVALPEDMVGRILESITQGGIAAPTIKTDDWMPELAIHQQS